MRYRIFVARSVGIFLSVAVEAGAQPRSPHAEPTEPVPVSADASDRGEGDEGRALLRRTKNRVNLRLGGASSDENGRPTVCLEVRAIAGLSIEGCGTGSGFLHNEQGRSLTHFRGKWAVDRRVLAGGVMQTQLGLGMTELQVSTDRPGFVVSPEQGGVEAVGPEAMVGLQWLRPIDGGWEFILNANAGLSWIPGAEALIAPQDTLQPFVAFEVGAGW